MSHTNSKRASDIDSDTETDMAKPTTYSVIVMSDGVKKELQSTPHEVCGVIQRHNINKDDKNHITPSKNDVSSHNSTDVHSEERLKDEELLASNLNANLNASRDTIVFDTKKMKCSTHVGELVTSWNGTRSPSNELRPRYFRSQSWCAQRPSEDAATNSEIRLLRERLLRTQARPQPAAIRHFTHTQRMTLVSLALVDFISFCSMSIMAPFFPKEAADKGMSETVSGFVFGFYAFIMFLSSPFFGKVLPSVGAKFLFMSGMFVAGVCNILFGALEYMTDNQHFTIFCFLIRGLEALGASAYSTASYVFVINTFPNNIGSVLGILETFVGLGMSIGPAVGGLLYSVGGFGLPFYTLGVVIVVIMPINCWLLKSDDQYTVSSKSPSMLKLFMVPSVVITGLVIVVVSNTWAFLDPTLEPHLREFNLSAQHVGLIFLLFSALYGVFSPIWGWLADRVQNHWCMMVWGLLLCTVGLLLLGPTPLIPALKSELWLNLVALSILGMSVALTLLPTFQGVLSSSISEGGCVPALSTYSVVAGVWSCCYSLGEVIGPVLGGALLQAYGFPICSTVMAGMCGGMALITLAFFSLRDSSKPSAGSSSLSSVQRSSELSWPASSEVSDGGEELAVGGDAEAQPLLGGTSRDHYGGIYTVKPPSRSQSLKSSRKSRNIVAYILMFKFLTDFLRSRKQVSEKNLKVNADVDNLHGYQRYLDQDDLTPVRNKLLCNADGSTPAPEEVSIKKDGSGLVPSVTNKWRTEYLEIIQYNMEKIKYYEQNRKNNLQEPEADRNQVTDIRGTVNMSSSGACEV